MSRSLPPLSALFAVVGLTLAATVAPACAGTIAMDQWYSFAFNGNGSPLLAGGTLGTDPASLAAPAGPWTIDLAQPATLVVVDGFLPGDRFALRDDGTLLGDTSMPGQGADCYSDIAACLAEPAISQGRFALAAGDASITGTDLTSPFGGGVGFFEIVPAAVLDAPGPLPLLAIGLAALAMVRRKALAPARARE